MSSEFYKELDRKEQERKNEMVRKIIEDRPLPFNYQGCANDPSMQSTLQPSPAEPEVERCVFCGYPEHDGGCMDNARKIPHAFKPRPDAQNCMTCGLPHAASPVPSQPSQDGNQVGRLVERPFPIGGDPKDFCICGHHEMNHADYEGLPRKCNQFRCQCTSYRPESDASPAPKPNHQGGR